jgi:branched-chain amino acid transport system permease protein
MDAAVAWIFLQQGVASGLVTGSIYALLAMSAVIIFKSTDVPNFALGEIFMAGAFLALVFLTRLGLPYWLVVPLAAVLTFALGAGFNYLALRPIERSGGSIVTLVIATLGFAYILKGVARLTGVANEPRSFPPLFDGPPLLFGDIVLTRQEIAILALALVAMAGFFWFFQMTRAGRAMRALAMNPRAAVLVGVDLGRTRMTVWGLSAALSAVAAVLVAPKILITPDMGAVAILAFAAAIIGGFTNLPGAVVGGFIIGIVENLVGTFIASNAIVVAPFVAIMAVLLVRPQGLFGGQPVVKKV